MPPPAGQVEQLIAEALGLPRKAVSEELEFRSVPEWDSLGHVELMLALEESLSLEIDGDLMTRLTSVRAIREHIDGMQRAAAGPPGAPPVHDSGSRNPLQRGLSGIYVDETSVSSIDGEQGRLSYRGYDIDQLASQSTFEETAFLLLHGHLPSAPELARFQALIEQAWQVPSELTRLLEGLRGVRPIDALRTAISALGALAGQPGAAELTGEQAARLASQVAALITEHQALRSGCRPDVPAQASYAERLLTLLTGRRPTAAQARAFDRCLILMAEHGSNASAFAGRVASGTKADTYAALTAAIATFAGPLHGGAVEAVGSMIDQIGEPERAAAWVRAQRLGKAPVFGFGHRIYRTQDPRAAHLRRMAEQLIRSDDDRRALAILDALRQSIRDHARHGMDVNVDLYAGLVFRSLGLAPDLYMAVFAASRTAGWLAHVMEQRQRNVLIRPSLRYAGETNRPYVPLAERNGRPAAAPVVSVAEQTDTRLHTGFLAWAGQAPHAPALRLGQRTWTYGQLELSARRWAGALLEGLGRPASRVCILAARSEVSYAGVLAALFAGGSFVPLNPDMPVERSRRMLQAAQPDALIVDRAGLPLLGELLDGWQPQLLLLPDAEAAQAPPVVDVRDRSALESTEALSELPHVPPEAIAYLLFTSGSTGAPKGVPISHANVVGFMAAAGARYGLRQSDRLSQTFQQTFDLSVFDLFMAWNSGACVCVPQPIDLVSPFRYVREQGITVWFSVPSLATLLLRKGLLRPGSLENLRWSLFCGEALPQATAEAWQAAAPNSIVENLYGPTECTIACTAYRWNPQRSPAECVNGLVPIGRPLDGVRTLVADDDFEPLPAGERGQLLVAGRQTFGGYWHNHEATQRAFHERQEDGRVERFYRTGDRVANLAGGNLVFLGRLDHQVQVLGHRVELGEVEAVLRAAPGVHEVVVLPWRLAAGTAEGLTAFVAGDGLDTAALAERAQSRLPAYMAPRDFRLVEEFPVNSSGKVDRHALQTLLED